MDTSEICTFNIKQYKREKLLRKYNGTLSTIKEISMALLLLITFIGMDWVLHIIF
jgi:hypothetical protein